jgi:hypothetical protein
MATTVPTKPAAKKTTKPVDWVAVMMRVASQGLQIVPVSLEDWPQVIGTDARVVLDGDVIWLSARARCGDLEVALQEADPHTHPYLKRPAEVVEIGGSTNQRARVLRRTPRSEDITALLAQ